MDYMFTIGALGFGIFNTFLLVLLFLREKPVKHGEAAETDDVILRNARRRSGVILEKAIERADAIITSAHKEGVSVLAKEKASGVAIETKYEEELKQMMDSLMTELSENEKKAEATYAQFLTGLGKTIEARVSESQGTLERNADTALKTTQEKIQAFVDDVHAQMKTEITKEITEARAALDLYKRNRMATVDDEIVGIVERTVKSVLGKTLPLADQADLVYKALEKAKADGFFA